MDILKFDLSKKLGKFKILNAVNGGPLHKRHNASTQRSNMVAYKAARIPYSRNHDSGEFDIHGGPYSHDISKIFRNFDADVNDPESYDFVNTDEDIQICLEAGTKTFYRLGETIELQLKKHATLPPKDFQKWAEICEHIIRHYNEGWANGYYFNIQYWEIWNEPDLSPSDDWHDKKTWGGTKAQFFDFYEVVAKHLKSKFPHLKIGGPALSGWVTYAEEFLPEMKKRNVPIDFFSWHWYGTEPAGMIERSVGMKNALIQNGYENAESILNEWNYVRGWLDDYVYSLQAIHGIKGASFTMACISEAQKSTIDMLMYYDTRPCEFNGAFDFYSWYPLKGYYPLKWYGMFYDMEAEVRCDKQPENIYTLCGVDKEGKALCVVTHYSEDDDAEEKEIKIDFGIKSEYEVYLLDAEHDAELIKTTDDLTFTMKVHSCIMIKQI